jgi:5-methylcytosine-specific restriction endonuclease McrA
MGWSFPSDLAERAIPASLAPDVQRQAWPPKGRRKGACNATIRVRDIDKRRSEGRPLGDAQRSYVAILDRGDGDECYLCGGVLNDGNRTIDHVVPKALGGGEALGNKKLACLPCNLAKGAMSLADYLARRRVA